MPRPLHQLIDFLREGVWRVRARELPRHRAMLLGALRVVVLALRGFSEDRCQLRASALTFYTLLSIVPVAAMAFGIAKGFGFERNLRAVIESRLEGHEEIAAQIIGFADTMLQSTRGGLVAGAGVLLLFWAVIRLLGNIEKSLNDIWGVRKGRTLGRKLVDYLALMLIGPVLLIAASSVTVYVSGQLATVSREIPGVSAVSPLILTLAKAAPVVVIWLLCSFIYAFLPNTHVRVRGAAAGGIVAGTLYQLVQWLYIAFQVGVARYNAIYGSFAALPLFLAWIQISWMIVLLGAEVAFALDHEKRYELEREVGDVSVRFHRLVALRIVQLCARAFEDGRPAPDDETLAEWIATPVRLVREVLFDLVRAGVLTEIAAGEAETVRYQPARGVAGLTIKSVLEALDTAGRDALPGTDEEGLEALRQRLGALDRLVEQAPENARLIDL
jgi:membrane protein